MDVKMNPQEQAASMQLVWAANDRIGALMGLEGNRKEIDACFDLIFREMAKWPKPKRIHIEDHVRQYHKESE